MRALKVGCVIWVIVGLASFCWAAWHYIVRGDIGQPILTKAVTFQGKRIVLRVTRSEDLINAVAEEKIYSLLPLWRERIAFASWDSSTAAHLRLPLVSKAPRIQIDALDGVVTFTADSAIMRMKLKDHSWIDPSF